MGLGACLASGLFASDRADTMRTIIRTFLFATTLTSAMLLSGCGGGGGGDTGGNGANPANDAAPASVTVISGKA